MRATFLSLVTILWTAFATEVAVSQTFFYINTISVDPVEPTTNDPITISLTGDLSSSGASIVSTSYMLMGNIVHITVNAADNGGLGVLVPHTEEVFIGDLPEGSYSILVDGNFILDSAPEFQHGFNVSGGLGCEALNIVTLHWATFNDSTIVLKVTNSDIGFDYPGFVLLDTNGDTLAVETVDFFAIGTESWHTLQVHPDAEIPTGTFPVHLHLWTGFFQELACTWELDIDLCSLDDCVSIYPYLINTGGGEALGQFTWTILYANQGTAASGTFILTEELQSFQEEVCLPVGTYSMVVTPQQPPTGGQLYMGVSGVEWSADVNQLLPQVVPTAPLLFTVVPACWNGPNAINNGTAPATDLVVRTSPGGFEISHADGKALGLVTVTDALGRVVYTARTSGGRLQLPVELAGVYVIQADTQRVKVFGMGL